MRRTLALLEPAVALLTNRLGDVLACTSGFERLMRGAGLLEADEPNLTWFVFTDPRSRTVFPQWGQVADEQAFNLWLGPSADTSEWFKSELAPVAGPEFTVRAARHIPPPRVPLRISHPSGQELRWHREILELPSTDAQQLVVFLPADDATARFVDPSWAEARSVGALLDLAVR